ncbi:MAG: trypsin-like peptidase domain-containing protein [Spirochaetaceae bacterium]|nr:trypsin-like peptidase domain-containing protein [Spirochaetaceae bacterium]
MNNVPGRGHVFHTLVILIFFTSILSLAAKSPRFPVLVPGETVQGTIQLGDGGNSYRTYLLNVPETASAVRVRITDANTDLDLYMRHGQAMENYDQADFFAETDEWLEELYLYKVYETWLPTGRYFLDVAYNWDEMPRENGEIFSSISFSLSYEIFDSEQMVQELTPGNPVDFELNQDNGYLSFYTLDIPRRTSNFRIDVLDTPGDVDLFLSREYPAPSRGDYLVIADTYLGRETIIMNRENSYLDAGRYYLTVFEATSPDEPVPVRLEFTLGENPPSAAPALPVIPQPADGPEAVRLATVQLVSPAGIGSGCLISADGLILTNHHVVVDNSGSELSEIKVALSLDSYEAPQELFTAEVIRSSPDDDLALIRIIGDIWGRPIPSSYRFPYWQLGDPEALNIGDPLLLMGYPWMGSGLSRSYITLTRGILSGGERSPSGLILKTDAVIAGGSSGGAVSDGRWRLLGLPTFVVSQDAAQLTFFVPVSRIPRDWRRLFR